MKSDPGELKLKSTEELKAFIDEERRRLEELRFKKSGGKLPNAHEMRKIRVSIARALTFIKGHESGKAL